MNILIPDSWLREFLKTKATPHQIQKYLSLCGPSVERLSSSGKDWIYDIEVTTNRVDCMSVIGIAREAAAILPQFGVKAALEFPRYPQPKTGPIPGLTITNNTNLCQRILALPVSGLTVQPSPAWLQQRLIAVGQRPLNNLVDITNYVMWEIGHPTHVFDLDRLSTGKMIIRTAKAGEKITSLDNKSYTLVGGEVIIEDGTGGITDLPSIIGTANSVVISSTTTALFFIEDITAAKVRFASMTHQIRTQAATLMEKDVDPHLGLLAMQRIIDLIHQINPSAQVHPLLDIFPHPPKSLSLSLSLSQLTSYMGINLIPSQITKILIPLGFEVSSKKKVLLVTPPTFRARDIQIPEDVIEEIARIYGYHRLPSVLMSGELPQKRGPDKQFYWESRIKYLLKHLGLTEIYTYSLVDRDSGLKLKNPLTSEWAYLRTSLTPSHKKIITENLGKASELNFFEIANVYLPRKSDLPEEQPRLIISSTNSDYSRLKGIIERIYLELGLPVPPKPDIVAHLDFLSWEASLLPLINSATDTKTYHPISKFTPIIEDINISHNRSYAEIENSIRKISPLIKHIDLIDKFGDKLTLRLTFHSDSKQLSSEDIAPLREKLISLSQDS